MSAVAQALQSATVAFGRTPSAAIANTHRRDILTCQRWTLVDEAIGGDGRADPPAQNPCDDDGPLGPGLPHPHRVPDAYRMGRLDTLTIETDMPGAAGGSRLRPRLGQPHGPDPAIDPRGLLRGCHTTTLRTTSRPTASRNTPTAADRGHVLHRSAGCWDGRGSPGGCASVGARRAADFAFDGGGECHVGLVSDVRGDGGGPLVSERYFGALHPQR